MKTKALNRVEIKDEARGEVTAVFATLNVIDSDGDVTRPGAFEDGGKVRISAYGHTSWYGTLPVGKGTIAEKGDEAIFTGRFFLDTAAGLDTFTVVKEMGDLQEWSYGFDVVEESRGEHEGQRVRFLSKLKTHEVSPVLLGAGVNTRTLAAKSGLKFSEHVDSVVADVDALINRATEVMALRAEKGKSLSPETAEHLAKLAGSLRRLEQLGDTPNPNPSDDEFAREYARFVSLAS